MTCLLKKEQIIIILLVNEKIASIRGIVISFLST